MSLLSARGMEVERQFGSFYSGTVRGLVVQLLPALGMEAEGEPGLLGFAFGCRLVLGLHPSQGMEVGEYHMACQLC